MPGRRRRRLRVHFPLDEITRRKRATQQKLRNDAETLLTQLGVQLLSFVQLDYREKARGGTGSDGAQWAPLSRATLEARVRRRAPARRIVEQRKQLADEIKQTKSSKKKSQLRSRRKQLLDRLNQLVEAEEARHEIGVDTGLQRASAAPGFTDPLGVWTEAPQDGRGENFFELRESQVTVGYNRTYSEEFDAQRPLMPSEPLDDWMKAFNSTTSDWGQKILEEEVGS